MENLSPTLEDVLDAKKTAEQSIHAALHQLRELTGLNATAVVLQHAVVLGRSQPHVIGVEIKLEL